MDWHVDDHLWVKTPYAQKDMVRDVLNGVWSSAKGKYKFPLNIHSMRELMRHFPQLQKDPQYVAIGKQMAAMREERLRKKAMQDCSGDARLRPYQRVDVDYLLGLRAAGIFNEPRTGKTPTSIILMKESKTKKNIVIAPASLCLNWAKEFEIWYPECDVFLVKGTPKQRGNIYYNFKERVQLNSPQVLIISKDTWKGDFEYFDGYKFDTVFVDEAHFLRNYDSKQSEAIIKIKATKRFALTGTPTIKHPSDIYGILRFLYPKRFTSYWQFVDRYFNQYEDRWGHKSLGSVKPQRLTELQELVGFIGVQRKRNEVMQWLPEKQYIQYLCEMGKPQEKLYTSMLNDFFAAAEGDDGHAVDTVNVLSQLTRLRQLCLEPRMLGFDVRGAKTDALLEWLDDNREPVVIMSMFTSYFEIVKPEIEKLGLRVGMITGKMTNAEKEKAKVDFQAGKLDVLLCNIISAGVGFTLDRAKVIVFMDKAWNPAENEQAQDRITPTTQEKNHAHEIISMVVKGTVDEKIDNILREKKSVTDLVNEGGRAAITKLIGGLS